MSTAGLCGSRILSGISVAGYSEVAPSSVMTRFEILLWLSGCENFSGPSRNSLLVRKMQFLPHCLFCLCLKMYIYVAL